MSVNGKECWSKVLSGKVGSQVCGRSNNPEYVEERFVVTCQATVLDGALTVRVHAELNSGVHDETFAIDNVVITKRPESAYALCA